MFKKSVAIQSPPPERLINTIWLKEDGIVDPYQNTQCMSIPMDARLLGVNTLSLIRKESHE
jgi:hypothetical protein